MTADITALEKSLVEWVVDWIDDEDDVDIDADTHLLSTGIIDSMGLVGLVTYLEEEASAEFDFSTFDAGEDASIRSLIQHCLGT